MHVPAYTFPWRRLLVLLAALGALAAAPALLAAQADVIRGRVTNTEGLPLPGVRVSATSIPGSVTREARTNNQGSYQIVFPGGPGDYMMGFALPGYDFRQFQIKRLADEAVLVADARLSVMMLDTLVVAAPVQQRVSRGERTPDVSGTERTIAAGSVPPEQQGNIAAMAASLPGVVLVPGLEGEPDGFSVLGLGGDQNNVTLNGMQVGAGNLPRDAAVSTSLATSPIDPSRGGFSGASFNIGSQSGSNFRTRGMSLQLTSPQVQWTDPAARALGNEYTNLSLGGTASGPIRRNKSFYNVSYELGRQSRDNQTLLGTSALGLRTAGI
ncbi:MAG TPA: TonB-dependent receptor, partial [Longimicrobiaceae bacterium]|nr:TonB-dependent receptor [Longimicrobiaceae bacterium]